MTEHSLTLTRRYDGLFIASFPDLPAVTAFGRDEEEAIEEAAKALRQSQGQSSRLRLATAPAGEQSLLLGSSD